MSTSNFIRYSELAAERLVKLWLHWDCIYRWSNLCKIQNKMLEIFEKLPKEVNAIAYMIKRILSHSSPIYTRTKLHIDPSVKAKRVLRIKAKFRCKFRRARGVQGATDICKWTLTTTSEGTDWRSSGLRSNCHNDRWCKICRLNSVQNLNFRCIPCIVNFWSG